jgi:NAD(P)H-dependent flavin oxidoreductase YrpB (nitropropane dioxygenase family)
VNWPGAPHRVLRNRLVSEWEAAGRPGPGAKPGEGTVIGRTRRPDGSTVEILRYSATMPTGAFEGDIELAGLWAGQSAALVHDIKPAGDIVRELARDADAILAERGPHLEGALTDREVVPRTRQATDRAD